METLRQDPNYALPSSCPKAALLDPDNTSTCTQHQQLDNWILDLLGACCEDSERGGMLFKKQA